MNCQNHKDRPSTHITAGNREPLCEECAAAAREFGTVVKRHRGFLWGYPIVVQDDDVDDVLEAEFIGE